MQPDEVLKDPVAESRARALSAELRCLVCQNQSIDDSDAQLAKDLRAIVRERIVAGDSDTAIRQFLVARYGEFVLLRPPFSAKTLLLWTLPFAAALGGAVLIWRRSRRRSAEPAEPALTEDEQSRLARLVGEAK